jgi:CDP-2,3-bis-(O-geranylgeranyl)-sn-glycerol synthase
MPNYIYFGLWFFLPAGVANVMPVLVAKMPYFRELETPVDGGHRYHGKRILGDHKTWRGLISGVAAAVLFIWLQEILFIHNSWARHASQQINYSSLPFFTLGFLLGFGALFGDMFKSFIKRQINVPAGHSWFPFDQIDYITGGLLFSTLAVHLKALQYLWIVLLWFSIHLVTSYLGFYAHLKESRI